MPEEIIVTYNDYSKEDIVQKDLFTFKFKTKFIHWGINEKKLYIIGSFMVNNDENRKDAFEKKQDIPLITNDVLSWEESVGPFFEGKNIKNDNYRSLTSY